MVNQCFSMFKLDFMVTMDSEDQSSAWNRRFTNGLLDKLKIQ